MQNSDSFLYFTRSITRLFVRSFVEENDRRKCRRKNQLIIGLKNGLSITDN